MGVHGRREVLARGDRRCVGGRLTIAGACGLEMGAVAPPASVAPCSVWLTLAMSDIGRRPATLSKPLSMPVLEPMKFRSPTVSMGLRLLGLAFLSSSLLKGLSPEQAISWLSSTGMRVQVSRLLVPLTGVVEAVVGATLLIVPGATWARIGALALFSVIVLARIGALIAGADSHCGCFGAVAVPEPLVWLFLIAGGLITARSFQMQAQLASAPRRKARLACVAALAALASAPMGLQTLNNRDARTWDEVLVSATSEPLLIVGATDCPHCRVLLAKVPASRLPDLAFIVREDDRGRLPGHHPKVYQIPARSWWNALEQAPPALFERRDGSRLRRLTETDFLNRLRQVPR